ncbi:hypothetical protein [Caulobacter sp. S45]|uniref:hypothetical protein n=1 Tax=Caulobacter sp. S45 TaxID=1641861 RepID=UPI00131D65A5|nr:hypothetical protein [Caulobacter sp. S45]
MSLSRVFAHWLMGRAATVAPTNRAAWLQAMQGEFETLEAEGPALSWAAGCFTSALLWNIHADAVYLFALAFAVIVTPYLAYPLMPLVHLPDFFQSPLLFGGVLLAGALITALPCLALGVYRPDRAVLTAFVVILTDPDLESVFSKITPSLFRVKWGWLFILALFSLLVIPNLAAAGMGAFIGRAARARRQHST